MQPSVAAPGSSVLKLPPAKHTVASKQAHNVSASLVTFPSTFSPFRCEPAVPAPVTATSGSSYLDFHPCSVSAGASRFSVAAAHVSCSTSAPSFAAYRRLSVPVCSVSCGGPGSQGASVSVAKPTPVSAGTERRCQISSDGSGFCHPAAVTFSHSQACSVGSQSSNSSSRNAVARTQSDYSTQGHSGSFVSRSVRATDCDGIFNIMESIVSPRQQRLQQALYVANSARQRPTGQANASALSDVASSVSSLEFCYSSASRQNHQPSTSFDPCGVNDSKPTSTGLAGSKRPNVGRKDSEKSSPVSAKKPRCTLSSSNQHSSAAGVVTASACSSMSTAMSASHQRTVRLKTGASVDHISSKSGTARSVLLPSKSSLPTSSHCCPSDALHGVNMKKHAMLLEHIPPVSGLQYTSLDLSLKSHSSSSIALKSQHQQFCAAAGSALTVTSGLDLSTKSLKTMHQPEQSRVYTSEPSCSSGFSSKVDFNKPCARSLHEVKPSSISGQQTATHLSKDMLVSKYLPISGSYDFNVEDTAKSLTSLRKFRPEIDTHNMLGHSTSNNLMHSMVSHSLASPSHASNFQSVSRQEMNSSCMPNSSTCKTNDSSHLSVKSHENTMNSRKNSTGLMRFPTSHAFSQFAAEERTREEMRESYYQVTPSLQPSMNTSAGGHTSLGALGNMVAFADITNPKSKDSFAPDMLLDSPPAKPLRIQPSRNRLEYLAKLFPSQKMQQSSADRVLEANATKSTAAVQRHLFKDEDLMPSYHQSRTEKSVVKQRDFMHKEFPLAVVSEKPDVGGPKKSRKSLNSKTKAESWQAFMRSSFGVDLSSLAQNGHQSDRKKPVAASRAGRDTGRKRTLSADVPVSSSAGKHKTLSYKRQLSFELKCNRSIKDLIKDAEVESGDLVNGPDSGKVDCDPKVWHFLTCLS
jgi:hypothetical protein